MNLCLASKQDCLIDTLCAYQTLQDLERKLEATQAQIDSLLDEAKTSVSQEVGVSCCAGDREEGSLWWLQELERAKADASINRAKIQKLEEVLERQELSEERLKASEDLYSTVSSPAWLGLDLPDVALESFG